MASGYVQLGYVVLPLLEEYNRQGYLNAGS